MHKIILVVIIGISILTFEYMYFCNRYYTSEIEDGNYIMKIKSKPAMIDKLVVGFFTMAVIGNIILLGWFAYKDQRKKMALKSSPVRKPIDWEAIDY